MGVFAFDEVSTIDDSFWQTVENIIAETHAGKASGQITLTVYRISYS